MSRETITMALFNLLCSANFQPGFQTTGRRLIMWTRCPAQPALFLRNTGDEYPHRPTGMPAKVVMECEAWIYSNAGTDPNIDPATGLNCIIDAVEAIMKPAPGFAVQTLGGLVAHAWIEGKIDMHPGDLDGQAIAVIPIKILVPIIN